MIDKEDISLNKKVRIGYACTPISIPYKTSRSFMLKNFSEELFKECTLGNLEDLINILRWNIENDIYMFRISSDIIPFGSHSVNTVKWWVHFKKELSQIGSFIKEKEIRVSMHPGQYTVLNSPSEDVLQRSLADLEYHCRFLDALAVDYTNKIVLHIGGVYGDKASAIERFVENFQRLSPSAQRRLIIENDDKSYTIKEVLGISSRLDIPVVFDNLHHKINPCDLEWNEILYRVKATWKKEDGRVKFHYSDQDMIKKGGAHSKSVVTDNFLNYMESIKGFDADIMLEVKDKEISAIKCICATDNSLPDSKKIQQWAKYKYSIMEKNYSLYKKCSSLINSKTPMSKIYISIDDCLNMPYHKESFVTTAQHIYGYVKDRTTEKEKDIFNNLLTSPEQNTDEIKKHLKKLCTKYGAENINNSYYFIL
jgi:UV DNA damage endonuclease